MQEYIYRQNQKLRCGYTTGTCAAAAAKGAVFMLLNKEVVSGVSLTTPKGITLPLDLYEIRRSREEVSCAVKKDAGDDFDVTHGVLIYAKVKKKQEPGYRIEGGEGVGTVTRAGLNQPIGAAAINEVPRKMILEGVLEICEQAGYQGGLVIEISIPDGVRLAEKTFNGRLGIVGGLSVLGTSGIVEPMSEKALLDTIRIEMRMQAEAGNKVLLLTPGNYGETFVKEQVDFSGKTVKCSNFIGEAIDMAYEFDLKGLLLVGHIGKLVKVAAGIMNTHSREADARMEVLLACALRAGARQELLQKLLSCVTTDEALALLKQEDLLEACMEILMERVSFYLEKRAYDGLLIGAIVFSNQFGELGRTKKADELLKYLRMEFSI